jgi:hypothetical protein
MELVAGEITFIPEERLLSKARQRSSFTNPIIVNFAQSIASEISIRQSVLSAKIIQELCC